MRRLTPDEVFAMERFLVADNDEAVGLEIKIGGDWRRGYSEPHTVKTYSAKELAGGELIEAEDVILCALVGDKLYYKTKGTYPRVEFTGVGYAWRGVSRESGDYKYLRATVSYAFPVALLPKEEILALDSILVKDNRRVLGARFERGSIGRGGSNTSDFSKDAGREYEHTAEGLAGRKPFFVESYQLCALVGDVLYFRYKDYNGKMQVLALDYRTDAYVASGESIAYDTASATRITLILRNADSDRAGS